LQVISAPAQVVKIVLVYIDNKREKEGMGVGREGGIVSV
jgi:hypothetical protein